MDATFAFGNEHAGSSASALVSVSLSHSFASKGTVERYVRVFLFLFLFGFLPSSFRFWRQKRNKGIEADGWRSSSKVGAYARIFSVHVLDLLCVSLGGSARIRTRSHSGFRFRRVVVTETCSDSWLAK